MDFSKTQIIDPDTCSYYVERVPADEHRCEMCSEPAEYRVCAEVDKLAQLTVLECQTCLVNDMLSSYSPCYFEVLPA